MRFSFEIIRARQGDCFILHFGSAEKPELMIIDGGPANVYEPFLKKRIGDLRARQKLGIKEQLVVSVVMVSHIDDDHINGLLQLTRELSTLRHQQSPLPVKVRSLWHNSFDDLLGTTPEQPAWEPDGGSEAGAVLASVAQGRQLRDDAHYLNWAVNAQFQGQLILADECAKPVEITPNLRVTVIGPGKKEIADLQQMHDKWLRERESQGQDISALAAYIDRSVPNLSSLVVLVECSGKTLLLTGDARGDKILEGLRVKGLMDDGLHVNILKIPHHGSSNNVCPDFFELIKADHYVFSGNGDHGNPERETLEMLFQKRPDRKFMMHFTYPIAEIDERRKMSWERSIRMAARAGKYLEAWSDETQGIAAYFAQAGIGQSMYRCTSPEQPHVLALLDPFL